MPKTEKMLMVIDESVFERTPVDLKHNERIARFLQQACAEFNIAVALRKDDLCDISQKAMQIGVFDTIAPDNLAMCDWESLQEEGAHVLISDRTDDTEKFPANFRGNSTTIPAGDNAFKEFMDLHRNAIAAGPHTDHIVVAQAEANVQHFLHIYDSPQALLDKIRKAAPVQALVRAFNKQAKGNDSLKNALTSYTVTDALDAPGKAEPLETHKRTMEALIDQFAAASNCLALLEPALAAASKIIRDNPGNELYFAA